jgi:hypothetical protein
MSALTVQVRRWSQAAASLLPPQQAVLGRVHSCYARIINVHTPSGRLLTLQGEGLLQAPLGLTLATDVAALGARLPVGALVVQDIPTARRSPAALHLRCTDALVWNGQVCACVRLGTSQLSGEFLRCAFAGHFAEPLVMLVRALGAPATDAWLTHAATLATVGQSSGVDAMVGIALGCRLLT